jgi:hypothetical protein
VAQHTFAVDEERAALDAHVLATVHALFLVDVEQSADLLLRVGQQLERKTILRPELLVRGERIGRDADDFRARLAELRIQVPESLAFLRAARGVVARVEVDHDVAAGQAGEPPGFAPGRR